MQEQPHYNITPEQGWSKIRPILDDAMPVNRPSRRTTLLWWSASAVLMSGVLGLFALRGPDVFTHYSTSTPPVKESMKKSDTGTIQTTNQTETNAPEVNAGESNSVSMPPGLKTGNLDQKSRNTKNEIIKAGAPLKNQGKPKPAEPIAASISRQQPAMENIHEETIAAKYTTSSSVPMDNVDKSVVQVAVPSAPRRNGQVIESLPGPDITALISAPGMDNISYPGSVQRTKTSTPFIEPGISVGALFGVHSGIAGIASAGADLNVSRRFSITTGIGYMAYRPDAHFLGSAKDLAANSEFNAILNYDPTYEGINTYVEGSSVNSAAGYNVINPLVENLRQWQVSAGLKWKMSGRLYTEAGAMLGFGTKAYSEYPIVSGDPLSASPKVSISNSLNTYDVIRSTMTYIYGGIGYTAGKHLDVFAQWTHGFDSYILSDPGSQYADLYDSSRTDYIRGLNLGLKYTL